MSSQFADYSIASKSILVDDVVVVVVYTAQFVNKKTVNLG